MTALTLAAIPAVLVCGYVIGWHAARAALAPTIAGLVRENEDQAAAIERLRAALRAEMIRHETTFRELDRIRSRNADLEAAVAVDDVYGDLFARYEGLA